MKQWHNLVLVFLIVLLVLPTSVNALGLGPSRMNYNYEPGKIEKTNYLVINKAPRATIVDISFSDELKEYAASNVDKLYLGPGEVKEFEVTLTHPQALENPGKHYLGVIITEAPPKSFGSNTVSARVSIEGQVYLIVPYPDKYLESNVNVNSPNAGDKVYLSAELVNRGSEEIKQASGRVDIFDSNNAKLASVPLTIVKDILPTKTATLKSEWAGTNLPGTYTAKFYVDYDDKSIESESEFKVGTLNVNVYDISGDYLTIPKVTFDLESMWNSELKDVYAEVLLKEDGNVVSILKTPFVNLKPWTRKQVTAFWENPNANGQTYEAEVTVYYSGTSTKKQQIFTFNKAVTPQATGKQVDAPKETASEGFNLANTYLLTIISAIILTVIAMFFLLNKPRRGLSYTKPINKYNKYKFR